MTKKNKVIFRLLGVFVVLLLVSLCLLGSTFARYTSSGSGTGSVTVAKWSLTNETTGTVAIDSTGLSPNMAKWSDSQIAGTTAVQSSGIDSNGYRYHSTAAVAIAEIKNDGAVNASLTITVSDNKKIDYGSNGETNITNGSYTDNTGSSENYSTTQVSDLFSIVLCSDTNGTALTQPITVSASNSVVIYGYVVWSSHDDLNSTTYDEEAADKLDTLVGENVTGITFSFEWVAVQASELPAVA